MRLPMQSVRRHGRAWKLKEAAQFLGVGCEVLVLLEIESEAVGGRRCGLRRRVGENVGIDWEKRCFAFAMAGD